MTLSKNTKLLFVDVETPNGHNNSICSIAAIETDIEGNVVDQMYSLVNPEAEFWKRNTYIHGIAAEDVEDAPTFAELWQNRLQPMFKGSRLVAHYPVFDMHVLAKVFRTYSIQAGQSFVADSRDTCYGGSLDVCAAAIGFDLDHHNALSDALCCKEVFFANRKELGWNEIHPGRLWQKFDFDNRCFMRYSEIRGGWVS